MVLERPHEQVSLETTSSGKGARKSDQSQNQSDCDKAILPESSVVLAELRLLFPLEGDEDGSTAHIGQVVLVAKDGMNPPVVTLSRTLDLQLEEPTMMPSGPIASPSNTAAWTYELNFAGPDSENNITSPSFALDVAMRELESAELLIDLDNKATRYYADPSSLSTALAEVGAAMDNDEREPLVIDLTPLP